MVAEGKQHSPTEKICRHFLVSMHSHNKINYGFHRDDGLPQVSLFQVSGTDEDAVVQHDVWGVDKESNLDDVLAIMNLYDSVAAYQSPYGRLVSAAPITYTFQPDDTQSRYVLDIRVVTTV